MKYILVLLLLLFIVHSSSLAATPQVTPTPKPTPVEYMLPYPGILPTHPLYFLKNLRDRIIELLIADSERKAEFYILQADKRVHMAILLKDQQKTTETHAAFTDAFAFRERAFTTLGDSIKRGRSIPGYLREKFFLSATKHKEVLEDNGESVESITALLTKAQQSLIKSE